MKILFTFFVPSGGVETLNRMRARALREYGVESHLLYTQPGTGLQNILDIPVYITNDDHEIKSIVEKEEFDAIVNTSDFVMSYRLRQIGYRGPILFEGQGFGTWKDAYLTVLEAEAFIRFHTQGILMPPTPHLLELFELLCPGVPRFVFPNMVDTRRFKEIETAVPAQPIIAWIGRLEPNKNWQEFLHICHLLVRAKPEISIQMFTDETLASPAERERFDSMVKTLGLAPNLRCLHSVPNDEMPMHYSLVAHSGGLLISTSKMEGFGYAVGEAMACSCPVLSTDSDGVKAFIIPDVTGKFYTLGNPEEAANAALELMNNEALRKQLTVAARQHLLTQLSPEAYAHSFLQTMQALGIPALSSRQTS